MVRVTTRKRAIILTAILLAAALLSACGSSPDEPTGQSVAQIETALEEGLDLTPDGTFSPAGGGTCAVLLIATDETADLYAEDSGVVWTPDGTALVKVNAHIPLIGEVAATSAACEQAVEQALEGGGGA